MKPAPGLLALVFAAVAPSIASYRDAGVGYQSGRDTMARSVSLPPDARVRVEATIGEIRITGTSDARTSVEIKAGSAAHLARLSPTIEEAAPGLRVIAVQPEGGMDRNITTSIRIHTPSSTVFELVRAVAGRIMLANLRGGVTADIRRGPIEASSLAGTIRLETGVGDVRVDQAELTAGGSIRLRAFNGDVALQLAAAPPDARILALTFNGRIASEIPLTMKDRFGPRFGEATLGRGDPLVSIDVVTGNITIRVAKR